LALKVATAAQATRVAANVLIVATVSAAALLAENPIDDLQTGPLRSKPYWHVKCARIDASPKVPAELIVNVVVVNTQTIVTDGNVNNVIFDYKLERVSWVALRIFNTSHTGPRFRGSGSAPIRASEKDTRSA
jgi:hypothetical protein